MSYLKKLLVSAGSVMICSGASYAADLPSKKSAPVEYVKICNAYGAGYFYIPGSDTCLRLSGRVRADYMYIPGKTVYSGISNTGAPTVSSPSDSQHLHGTEMRARLSFDARTPTSMGTVQTVAQFRMARKGGVLQNASAATNASAGVDLEAAYVRFAGFTFGAAKDNFVFMDPKIFGDSYWSTFSKGAKQLAYTATFGGGFSGTIALQDRVDTARSAGSAGVSGSYEVYNSVPQLNANLNVDQSWGSLQFSGAYSNISVNNATNSYDESKGAYALGMGLKLDLPMLAKGDTLWLTTNYADGMSEYTAAFLTTKDERGAGGFSSSLRSYVTTPTGIQTVKSWNVAAALDHFWAPQYRSTFFASYAALKAPAGAEASAWNGSGYFGDASVWNAGANFVWIPVRNFEIGAEVMYSQVKQDVRSPNLTVYSGTDSNWTGRLRVERNF
jgi:hypothetical protein